MFDEAYAYIWIFFNDKLIFISNFDWCTEWTEKVNWNVYPRMFAIPNIN